MRGRTLARSVATAQALLLAGALIIPSTVAAATLDFTLNAPSAASVHYSDLVTLRGSYTCVNDATSTCPTTLQSSTATFALRPSGGSAFLNVGTVTSSFTFTGSAGGCPTTCTQNFQLSYKAGRSGTTTLPPGLYDIGLTTTMAAGQQVLLGGLTIAQEGTTTAYAGLTTGLGNTSLALSASVVDLDRGLSLGTGIYSPDTNLFGASLVTFALYDSTNTTLLAGPVSATLLASGVTNGSPSLLLPAAGGSLRLRTTFVGNSFYTSSADLDTITVAPSNTPPVLSVPAGPIVEEATSPTGAVVNFVVTATDAEDDPDPMPTCDWDSGDTFPIGDTTVHCAVTDSGALGDADSFLVTVADTTDPAVSITTSESIGSTGWYNLASNDATAGLTVDVTVTDAVGATSLSCTDNGDPVGPLGAAGGSFVVGDGAHAIECSASDAAGNEAGDSASFSVDQTVPSITAAITPDPDAATAWWNIATGAPTVTYDCTDATAGIASCPEPFGFGEGADQGHTGTAVDAAGNAATASVSNIDVDHSAPTDVAFTGGGLTAGGSYAFGLVPAGPTGCTATDTVAGLGSCSVSGYSALVGTQAVAALATDNAGNTAATSLGYSVLPWTLVGFANPVSMTGPNLVKGGSNVNLKFEVFAGSTEVTSLDAVTGIVQTQISCGAPLFVAAPTAAVSTRGSSLKYDGTAGQYFAKFDAPSGSGTCWLISVLTEDGSSLSAVFTIK
jgi:hypothetical protein